MSHRLLEESLAICNAMTLVAFRDSAWARMIGSLLGGGVDYVFSAADALKCAGRRKPRLIFLSSYLAETVVIEKLLQRSPDSLVVYIARSMTNRQRQAALDAGAYEALDCFTDEFPQKIEAIVAVSGTRATSSLTSSALAPVLRLIP